MREMIFPDSLMGALTTGTFLLLFHVGFVPFPLIFPPIACIFLFYPTTVNYLCSKITISIVYKITQSGFVHS